MEEKSDLMRQRRENLQELERLGHDPYPHRYSISHRVTDVVDCFSPRSAQELEQEQAAVQTAGRVVALRRHGKAGFAKLFEGGAHVQAYVRQDRVGEDAYRLYRLLDIGDFVGVKGVMQRTRTGELTVFVDELTFLSKSLRPLPEKWHGLSDVELRHRQRYLDLMANQRAREVVRARSRMIGALRAFLEQEGFIEVETPMMQPIAGGALARPFKTHHEALDIPLYLRIAPELYLKRLIVGGLERVYEINRNFRNEGVSTQHNPEFTMLEFYQAYADYEDFMDLTERLIPFAAQQATGGRECEYNGNRISLEDFDRLTMVEAIVNYWEGEAPPVGRLEDRESLLKLLADRGVEVEAEAGWGKLLGRLFEEVAEEKLIKPTFIYDFPAELSPLSRRKEDDERYAERFELFIGGLELANAYSELNDPVEQESRFREQLEARKQGDLEAHQMDADYIRALSYGMPPTAGEGIGIDRLTMLLTDSRSIRDVILFPHLRPEKGE